MPSFKDNSGREWLLTLDGPKIGMLKRELLVDFGKIDDAVYQKLDDDPELFVNVLWALCREQAQAAAITSEQFGVSLVGDAVEHAANALIAAVCDFFPNRKRTLLKTLAAKREHLTGLAMDKAMERLNDPNLEAKLLAMMDAETNAKLAKILTPKDSATNSPASSASAPTA